MFCTLCVSIPGDESPPVGRPRSATSERITGADLAWHALNPEEGFPGRRPSTGTDQSSVEHRRSSSPNRSRGSSIEGRRSSSPNRRSSSFLGVHRRSISSANLPINPEDPRCLASLRAGMSKVKG